MLNRFVIDEKHDGEFIEVAEFVTKASAVEWCLRNCYGIAARVVDGNTGEIVFQNYKD